MKYMKFGRYDWRVLDEQGGRALVITRDIIEIRPYDAEFTDEVWESCGLREYLNGEFFDRAAGFTESEQARIAETKIVTPNNQWYGTWGGKNTLDKIFLLSLEEADRYFGDSGDYIDERQKEYDFESGRFNITEAGAGGNGEINGGCFSNGNDADRAAEYSGAPAFWWLRSSGIHNGAAAFVFDNGGVGVFGLDLCAMLDVSCGVRPAMRVEL